MPLIAKIGTMFAQNFDCKNSTDESLKSRMEATFYYIYEPKMGEEWKGACFFAAKELQYGQKDLFLTEIE